MSADKKHRNAHFSTYRRGHNNKQQIDDDHLLKVHERSDKQYAHFMFLDLVELENQKADTIVSTLLNCLAMYGFDDTYLTEHLIAFASDGTSVMTGNKSGVALQLANKYPNIVTWHCLNHRIELAVADAAADTTGVNHFRSFMDALYSLYSRSPKTQKRLETEAAELDIQLKKNRESFEHALGGKFVQSC